MTGGDQRGWRAACPFCLIIRGRAPVSRVYEDASTLAFMDVNPVQRGHVHLIPVHRGRPLLRLLAEEVIPALREHGKRLGLVDPFARAPGSRPLPADGKPDPVAWPELLRAS